MKVIIRNGKVIRKVQDTSSVGIPLVLDWTIPEPFFFYHTSNPTYDILEDKVIENRIVTLYPLEYCKGIIKEELRKQRVERIASGLIYDGDEYHADEISLLTIPALPDVIPVFKHKNGWTIDIDVAAFKLACVTHVQSNYGIEALASAEVDAIDNHEDLIIYYNDLVSK